MPLCALLFDLDGVLVYSEEAWFLAVEEAGVRFRGRPVTRDEFLPTFGQGTDADIRQFGLACTAAELDRFYGQAVARHATSIRLNPEAPALLAWLRQRGLKLALATNTVSSLARVVADGAGLTAAFDHLGCADLVALPKPAPDLLLSCLAALQTDADEAWMVGDSRFDRDSARDAGVRFVGLGLDGDARIERLTDLRELVEGQL